MEKNAQRSRRWRIATLAIAGTFAGLALALSERIATDDMVIDVQTTPEANVITVTDVQRQGDRVTPLGPPRVYTEQRP